MRDGLFTSQLQGDSEATPPPAAKSIWIPALTLSILAITLRILVATRREGIEVDGIIYLQNAEALWKDWTAVGIAARSWTGERRIRSREFPWILLSSLGG